MPTLSTNPLVYVVNGFIINLQIEIIETKYFLQTKNL